MSAINLDERRQVYAQFDKDLIDRLIMMHADMCVGKDLANVCPDKEDIDTSRLAEYESILVDTINRLKRLSPHFT